MKIPTYWFCFAIAFAATMLFPLNYRINPRFPPEWNILASAYLLDVWSASWKTWIFVVHQLIASTIALSGTLFIHSITDRHKASSKASLQHFFVLTAIAALIIACFTRFRAPIACTVASMIPFVGYAACGWLVGLIERKTAP